MPERLKHMQIENELNVLHHEKRRILLIYLSLLAMTLAFILFFLTKNIIPMFLTIVLTFLCYQRLDPSPVQTKNIANFALYPDAHQHPGHIGTEQEDTKNTAHPASQNPEE